MIGGERVGKTTAVRLGKRSDESVTPAAEGSVEGGTTMDGSVWGGTGREGRTVDKDSKSAAISFGEIEPDESEKSKLTVFKVGSEEMGGASAEKHTFGQPPATKSSA